MKDGIVPKVQFWGPQDSLASVIGAGSHYEEWTYKNNKDDYYVWFSSGVLKNNWIVVDKGAYPHDAVFEARK